MEDPYPETDPEETAQAAERLRSQPALEDMEARMVAVIEQIAAAGTELVPAMRWHWNRDRSEGPCSRPYDQTQGRQAHLRLYVSDTPIPDDVWPSFLERVRGIVASLGMTAPETMQDNSRGHDVWFSNPETGGTILKVATERATVLSADVACYLPQAVLDQTPRPTP